MLHYAEDTIQHSLQTLSQQQQALAQQQRQRLLTAQADEHARRVLGIDQRCLGGTVITVRGNAYTQDIGEDGRPVRCTGNLASLPLR